MSLSSLMAIACPDVQKQYHAQLMPLFLSMMASEEKNKMKAQVVSATISFVTHLTGTAGQEGEDADPDLKDEGQAILNQYSQALVESISVLFQLSIDRVSTLD